MYVKLTISTTTWFRYAFLAKNLCHLAGNYQQALQCYRDIHERFPDNIDCLKFLVRLSSDMGLAEAQKYSLLLSKAEKAAEARRMVRRLYDM